MRVICNMERRLERVLGRGGEERRRLWGKWSWRRGVRRRGRKEKEKKEIIRMGGGMRWLWRIIRVGFPLYLSILTCGNPKIKVGCKKKFHVCANMCVRETAIHHFTDMLASEDYQKVNHEFRLPALKDTCILCTTELDPELSIDKAKL